MTFDDTVLYCDNHLLVINKPAGMLSQGDRSGDEDVLTAGKRYLKVRFDKPGNVYLGLVHRLDRPVSGVMVLARTSKAAARLSTQFRERDVEKGYVALVEGQLDRFGAESGYIKKEGRGVAASTSGATGALYSELSWEAVAQSSRGTLVGISLVTGRKHQIRHQLAEIGHPIVGDLRYGAKGRFDGRNIALHCYSVTIDHPTRGERMTWSALPPGTWGPERAVVRTWMSTRGYQVS